MVAAARSAVTPFSGHAELNVSSDGGVPLETASRLAQLPGVARAEPLVFGRVRLPDLDDRPAQVIGLVWCGGLDDNPWSVTIDWVIRPQSIPGLTRADPQRLLAIANRWEFHPALVGQDLGQRLSQVPTNARIEAFLDLLVKRLLTWNDKLAPLVRGRVVEVQPVGQDARKLISVGTVHAENKVEDAFLRNALIMNAADAASILGQPGRRCASICSWMRVPIRMPWPGKFAAP